jgi:hypothetical protein
MAESTFKPWEKPRNKMQMRVLEHLEQVLGGRLLAIDPSSGSAQSLPGYAIYEKGELIDSGVIDVPTTQAINCKLYQISRCLREEFQAPDVLVIESIAPYFSSAKGGFRNRSVMNLHRGVGAIMAGVNCERLIEVAPASWRQKIPEDYEKTDENDAIMMGYTVIAEACAATDTPIPKLRLELSGNSGELNRRD